MRRFSILAATAALLIAATSPLRAAVLWSETTENGRPSTHWAKGATIEEVSNLMRTYVGSNSRTIVMCRQSGWFAYVGSSQDVITGVTCGYETDRAALFAARQQCQLADGKCEIERIGFDKGEPSTALTPTSIPIQLPGSISPGEPEGPSADPITYDHVGVFKHYFSFFD